LSTLATGNLQGQSNKVRSYENSHCNESQIRLQLIYKYIQYIYNVTQVATDIFFRAMTYIQLKRYQE